MAVLLGVLTALFATSYAITPACTLRVEAFNQFLQPTPKCVAVPYADIPSYDAYKIPTVKWTTQEKFVSLALWQYNGNYQIMFLNKSTDDTTSFNMTTLPNELINFPNKTTFVWSLYAAGGRTVLFDSDYFNLTGYPTQPAAAASSTSQMTTSSSAGAVIANTGAASTPSSGQVISTSNQPATSVFIGIGLGVGLGVAFLIGAAWFWFAKVRRRPPPSSEELKGFSQSRPKTDYNTEKMALATEVVSAQSYNYYQSNQAQTGPPGKQQAYGTELSDSNHPAYSKSPAGSQASTPFSMNQDNRTSIQKYHYDSEALIKPRELYIPPQELSSSPRPPPPPKNAFP